jgi:hypothetical protein
MTDDFILICLSQKTELSWIAKNGNFLPTAPTEPKHATLLKVANHKIFTHWAEVTFALAMH